MAMVRTFLFIYIFYISAEHYKRLFIIEGSITVFIGLCSILILPDYPHNTKWLSADERRLAQIRLAEDAAEADEDKYGDTCVNFFLHSFYLSVSSLLGLPLLWSFLAPEWLLAASCVHLGIIACTQSAYHTLHILILTLTAIAVPVYHVIHHSANARIMQPYGRTSSSSKGSQSLPVRDNDV